MMETGIPSVISRRRLITESRFSHAGEARTRIYADGDNAYCIEPGISLHTGKHTGEGTLLWCGTT